MVSFAVVVVVGLSSVFGVMTLAIAAEMYYMIFWKKKKPLTAREIDEINTSYVHELLYVLSSPQQQQQQQQQQQSDLEIGSISSRTLLLKPSSSTSSSSSSCGASAEESVESELMRLHKLSGPPRFLFTIKEETREDLESEDRSRKGSRTRSLSDVILTCNDTPFLTPIASPRLMNHQCPNSLDFYNHLGFNPLYEATDSLEEIEFKLKHSPPPKFKFLRDAEEKLQRRLKEQMMKKNQAIDDDQIGSLITLISGVKMDKDCQVHHNSASSKVIPLESSPSRFKLLSQ